MKIQAKVPAGTHIITKKQNIKSQVPSTSLIFNYTYNL